MSSSGLIRDSRDSLNFMMCPKFQLVKDQYLDSPTMRPYCCNRWSLQFSSIFLKYARTSLKKMASGWVNMSL